MCALCEAKNLLVRQIQEEEFNAEGKHLKTPGIVGPKLKILYLNPDDDVDRGFSTKSLSVMPSLYPVTKLSINDFKLLSPGHFLIGDT